MNGVAFSHPISLAKRERVHMARSLSYAQIMSQPISFSFSSPHGRM